jgi:hypothetical protein
MRMLDDSTLLKSTFPIHLLPASLWLGAVLIVCISSPWIFTLFGTLLFRGWGVLGQSIAKGYNEYIKYIDLVMESECGFFTIRESWSVFLLILSIDFISLSLRYTFVVV